MRPAFRYCAGWACAALAATTVSWVAIRDVVATAAVGDPVPAGAVVAGAGSTTEPTGRGRVSTPTATTVPSVSLSPGQRIRPSSDGPATAPSGRPTEPSAPGGRSPWPSSTGVGDYKGYVLEGGQVVVQLRADSASLVTAVPASGYETQTWETDAWFRVDFVARRAAFVDHRRLERPPARRDGYRVLDPRPPQVRPPGVRHHGRWH